MGVRHAAKLFEYRDLKVVARLLRAQATRQERALWDALKDKGCHGLRFRRQHQIGTFIVDFYCASEKLVVELDGAQHSTAAGRASDEERDALLKKLGVRVLRFENSERPEDIVRRVGRVASGDVQGFS